MLSIRQSKDLAVCLLACYWYLGTTFSLLPGVQHSDQLRGIRDSPPSSLCAPLWRSEVSDELKGDLRARRGPRFAVFSTLRTTLNVRQNATLAVCLFATIVIRTRTTFSLLPRVQAKVLLWGDSQPSSLCAPLWRSEVSDELKGDF